MKNRKSFFPKPNAKRDTLRDAAYDTEVDLLLGECQRHGSTHVLEADGFLPDPTLPAVAEADTSPALSLAYAANEPLYTFKDDPKWQNAIAELRAIRAA
jgi:hypothetical protein